MGDGNCQFTERCYTRYMCEFYLGLAQLLFGVICEDRRGDIGAGASVTEKIAACVKKWFAACLDICPGSSPVDGVHEIAKWPMCVEHRPMQSPFFGFRFKIGRNLPARHAQYA